MKLFLLLTFCMATAAIAQIDVKFSEYKLDNGLTVCLHVDHSAPVTAIVIQYHVGSKNEHPGRTGFAHLFEHMMFEGSEHLPKGKHFALLQEIGANLNANTTEDATTYFDVVPSNYTELPLYLESDRMGFLLPAVTQATLDNQRDVVKNERRQSVDNVPYGTADEKIGKIIYPPTHPYNWPVIGSMQDLSAASLEDVENFFRTYYVPNNATLCVAGDIDTTEVKGWIEKYFGPIPKGKEIVRPEKVPVTLDADKEAVVEDSVHLPRLYITWPTEAVYSREAAVLDVVARVLSATRASRLDKALMYDRQIAANVSASQDGSEIAGVFQIVVTAKPKHNLNEMKAVVDSVLADLLANGVTQQEIDNALTATEVRVVNGAQTDLGKANQLVRFNSFLGNSDYINHQMDIYKGITPAEVLATAKKYLTRPKLTMSVVPVGKTQLAVSKKGGM
jgi:zinc protease